ncbi:chromate efflux transporter [Paracidovorax anthurii]|uniref:Chromate transporter n=1 Tax=Paracidovorax anthurii TaxID=78229 RepID=A0A328ZSI5_9BURK|nr:chromate efflux transporter [Paracidovorax anthurii]RAR85827.1 chromate transporter [Paracidovorax anthurii]
MDTVPLSAADSPRPPSVSLSEALRFWLKLGFIGFGGPAGQIALMHDELVDRRRWISERRFLHALNYCMLLPGPEAQQLATYLGWLLHRTWGGILAGLLFVLPSLFIMIALAWLYMAQGDTPAVAGLFHGIKPAVTALVAQAAARVGARSLRNGWLGAIAAAAFVALFAFDVPFPLIVMAAAVLGHAGGRWRPEAFGARAAGPAAAGPAHGRGPALIDDDTPVPGHARFSWRRLRNVFLAGAGLWLLAIGGLVALYGWNSVLAQMGWFFTKAALMTFGGAYAVLPYVYQGAVEHFHWITPAHMIDGLALGETTPGPLIMVVSFVAFVGGWTQALFGPDAPLLAGAVAASVVTFFTFLPSFVFILLGGPFIESTHGNLRLTAPLAGITAAVVGVIVNLAVFFAWHVFWPKGLHGGIDGPSVLIGLAAAVALMRYRVGAVPVIVAAGLAGFALGL